MSHIIAFGGSSSKTSINKKLAIYAAKLVNNVAVEILDLNDFELPLYSVDYEDKNGIPDNAKHFLDRIKASSGIVLSLAEHNGAYTVAFKNLLDWMSRIEGKVWNDKPMLLMATSPGERGGATVLEIAIEKFDRMGANIKTTFKLPSFNSNFSDGKIVDEKLNKTLLESVENFGMTLK